MSRRGGGAARMLPDQRSVIAEQPRDRSDEHTEREAQPHPPCSGELAPGSQRWIVHRRPWLIALEAYARALVSHVCRRRGREWGGSVTRAGRHAPRKKPR